MMEIEKIPPVKNGFVNVIIETPKGSQVKYNYDPELKLFKFKKTLPMGMVFPFDFGFVPGTLGEDGDPVDVLVFMDQPAYPGVMIECRLLCVLEAKQKERNGKEIRNDRMIAVPHDPGSYGNNQKLDINKSMTEMIENFFIDYNNRQGKKFMPIKWGDAKEAMELIRKGINKVSSKQ